MIELPEHLKDCEALTEEDMDRIWRHIIHLPDLQASTDMKRLQADWYRAQRICEIVGLAGPETDDPEKFRILTSDEIKFTKKMGIGMMAMGPAYEATGRALACAADNAIRLYRENGKLKAEVRRLRKFADECRDKMVKSGRAAGGIVSAVKFENKELRAILSELREAVKVFAEFCEADVRAGLREAVTRAFRAIGQKCIDSRPGRPEEKS